MTGQSRILIVGTQPAVMVALRTMLTLRQLDVLVTDDPHMALQIVGLADAAVRLALIDVSTLHVEPRALAGCLREAQPGLKTLFFSSLVDGEVIRLGIIDPTHNVVRKEGVMAVIEEALDLNANKTMTAGSGAWPE